MKPVRLALDNVGSPRLRLTLAYAGILVLLLVAFSVVVFALLSMLVWKDVEPFRDDPSIVAAGHRMLVSYAWRLAIANLGGLVLVAGAAFLLAKVTLRPLEQAIALQQQFTNDASHDLRTPLAVIRTETSAALASGEALSADAIERLTIIDEQARRMERLIDQLLTLSHVDTDSALNREPADLAAVVKGVVRDIAPLAQARQIGLNVDRSESAVVLGDELKLSQMVGNLLDNAIKYSPPGSPIDVVLTVVGADAQLRVADRGVGVPAEERDRLFAPYFRSSRTREISGTGLGLHIGQRIAAQHYGRLTLESSGANGVGSVFLLALPLAKRDDAPVMSARPARSTLH